MLIRIHVSVSDFTHILLGIPIMYRFCMQNIHEVLKLDPKSLNLPQFSREDAHVFIEQIYVIFQTF